MWAIQMNGEMDSTDPCRPPGLVTRLIHELKAIRIVEWDLLCRCEKTSGSKANKGAVLDRI